MDSNNNSGDWNSGNRNSGHWNSGNWNSGNRNSGDWNSGDRNSGDWNSGNRNSGDWNSGDWNSGDRNSGDRNSGDRNSGNWNSGDRNSGNRNSGDRNSGNRNSGNLNSGDWNSGNRNSGYLNSTEPTVRMFNRDTGRTYTELGELIPRFFYFDLNEWIQEEAMTDEEKETNPTYKTTGGYLKVREYKEAWREAWDKATNEDRRKVLALPNWDNAVFLEITGIDVEKELNSPAEVVEVNGRKYKLIQE